MTPPPTPSRDDTAEQYLESLIHEPYPFQEEAIFSWFSSEQGVLVCAPTGMGKTLIAEAALFEAVKLGKTAYYTTPLIALTEQKFRDLQESAVRWGLEPTDVGLVTGNRRENPDAKLLVVVAEILFNRLLHPEAFDFRDVWAVVMDEFHSFNDPERGIVWELTLGLLPSHVRTLLLSATVGNAYDFVAWLRDNHHRRLDLVQSDERKVPLHFEWVPDALLTEHLVSMAEGNEEIRSTPALVFCFNREECWTVAEQIKGKQLIDGDRQKQVAEAIADLDWSQGAGPKLKQLLLRGVGVHHAGVLPIYRRIVEDLFQRKLLSIAVCTETLAAGINLPARSVVLPCLIKGPPGKKRIIDPSSAHQIFGRAGRPQYDTRGHVFALAHEDDVKIHRWRLQYEQIPENAKDPKMLLMKKKLKKKQPKRRSTEQYWTEEQYTKLIESPPGKLASHGGLPWRLLAFMLQASPDVTPIRELVGKRLSDPKRRERGLEDLDHMLLTLYRSGYVALEPEPFGHDGRPLASTRHLADPANEPQRAHGLGATYVGVHQEDEKRQQQHEHWGDVLSTLDSKEQAPQESPAQEPPPVAAEKTTKDDDKTAPAFGSAINLTLGGATLDLSSKTKDKPGDAKRGDKNENKDGDDVDVPERYRPLIAQQTPDLQKLLLLRSVNPLYGVFLVNQLGIADRAERIQAIESVLELPGSVAYHVRPPRYEEMPPGPLATQRLDAQLLRLGLATAEELSPKTPEQIEEERDQFGGPGERVFVLNLADKLRRLFDYDYPFVRDIRTNAVWVVGELLEFGGDFNKYITSKKLQKQEGMVFRHILRMILLLKEFSELCPPDVEHREWRAELREIGAKLTECCRRVDQTSTDETIEQSEQRTDDPNAAASGANSSSIVHADSPDESNGVDRRDP